MEKMYKAIIEWVRRSPGRILFFAFAAVLTAVFSAVVDFVFGAAVAFFSCFLLEMVASRVRGKMTEDYTFNLRNVLAAVVGIAVIAVPIALMV